MRSVAHLGGGLQLIRSRNNVLNTVSTSKVAHSGGGLQFFQQVDCSSISRGTAALSVGGRQIYQYRWTVAPSVGGLQIIHKVDCRSIIRQTVTLLQLYQYVDCSSISRRTIPHQQVDCSEWVDCSSSSRWTVALSVGGLYSSISRWKGNSRSMRLYHFWNSDR